MQHLDHLLRIRVRQGTSVLQNALQFRVWELRELQLYESAKERPGEDLAPAVQPGWILGAEEHELRVSFDHLEIAKKNKKNPHSNGRSCFKRTIADYRD